jgi:SAM-dependent methyltransferase
VVAIDVDTRFIEAIEEPNLEVQTADVAVTELETASFDLIHARLVLEHIPTRQMVLGKLCEALKPGGVVFVEGNDFLSFGVPGPESEQVTAALERIAATIGWDMHFGRCLPSVLQTLGLRDVAAAGHVQFFPGGSPLAVSVKLSLEELRPRLLQNGLSEEVLDKAIADCDAAAKLIMPPFIVQAWGRR